MLSLIMDMGTNAAVNMIQIENTDANVILTYFLRKGSA